MNKRRTFDVKIELNQAKAITKYNHKAWKIILGDF